METNQYSISSSYFDRLPDELLVYLDGYLPVEDSLNWMISSDRVRHAIQGNFSSYDQLQLSDDPNECRIVDSKGRKKERRIKDTSTPFLLEMAQDIREVTIVIKEVDLTKAPTGKDLKGCSPYIMGGYLGSVIYPNLHKLSKLTSLNLHVDMMIESFKEGRLDCPIQDLSFALNYLSEQKFETFVSISLCCAEFNDNDAYARNHLISTMEHALKAANQLKAHTQFVVEPSEGYVDMTVEKGNVEYSFAFFYYNPMICEPVDQQQQQQPQTMEIVESTEKQRTPVCA